MCLCVGPRELSRDVFLSVRLPVRLHLPAPGAGKAGGGDLSVDLSIALSVRLSVYPSVGRPVLLSVGGRVPLGGRGGGDWLEELSLRMRPRPHPQALPRQF